MPGSSWGPPLLEGFRPCVGSALRLCQPQGFCGAGNSAELGLPALPHSTFCCLPGRG